MEYANYPFECMRITQRHDEGNHIPHWNPFIDYADKPWDEACKDGGRSYFIPQNDYVVDEVLMLQRSLRLSTINKVKIPYQEEPVILHLTLTHMKEEDLKKIKKGQIAKKGTKFILEGNEGGAYGYHFHCTANIGNYYDIKKNANGANCFVYDKSLLPFEAFYVDESFTNVLDNNKYTFQVTPKTMKKGDTGTEVEKTADFLSNFVKGNYYGDYMEACVSVYKRQHNLGTDGSFIDNKTLEQMKKDGLNV